MYTKNPDLTSDNPDEDLQALANSTSLNRRVNKTATNSASLYLYRKSINICNDLKRMPFQQIADMNVKDNSISMLDILSFIANHWVIDAINHNMNYTTPKNFHNEQQFFLNKILTKNFRNDPALRKLELINKKNLKFLIQTHHDVIFSNILACFRKNINLHGMEPFILPPDLPESTEPHNESETVLEHNQTKIASCFPGMFSLFKRNQKKREPNRDNVCANKSKDKTRSPNDTAGPNRNSHVIRKAQINKNNCKQSFYEVYDRTKMLLSIQAKEDKLFFTNFERKQIYHIAQTMEKIEGCETITPDNTGAYFKKALSI